MIGFFRKFSGKGISEELSGLFWVFGVFGEFSGSFRGVFGVFGDLFAMPQDIFMKGNYFQPPKNGFCELSMAFQPFFEKNSAKKLELHFKNP